MIADHRAKSRDREGKGQVGQNEVGLRKRNTIAALRYLHTSRFYITMQPDLQKASSWRAIHRVRG
jgi:hypothetical protein